MQRVEVTTGRWGRSAAANRSDKYERQKFFHDSASRENSLVLVRFERSCGRLEAIAAGFVRFAAAFDPIAAADVMVRARFEMFLFGFVSDRSRFVGIGGGFVTIRAALLDIFPGFATAGAPFAMSSHPAEASRSAPS